MALRKVAGVFAQSGLQIQATPALVNSASFAQGSLPRLFAKGGTEQLVWLQLQTVC